MNMKDVFISYSRKDEAAVMPIYEALLPILRKTSWEDADFAPETTVAERLRTTLSEARCIVVVWSQAAAESEFVQEEIRDAIRAWSAGRLVLATLDDTPLPVGLRDISAIARL
jgi:hypothetical protein